MARDKAAQRRAAAAGQGAGAIAIGDDPVRGKPRRSGAGKDSAGCVFRTAAGPVLVRSLLLFDVLAHDGNRGTTAGGGEVGRPQDKARVQRLHIRIGNARRDYLHKTSTTISKNHAMLVIEDLQVRNMSASAAGTVEAPGAQVRAKTGLNKAILDQGWFEFRRQLDYKTGWAGGHLAAVPARNTSRTCSACGHIAAENRQTQARFACVECGFEDNADLVGAINVLRAGYARLACAVSPSGGQQQEPTEAALREHTRAERRRNRRPSGR